jgi:copper chaperone CopZ
MREVTFAVPALRERPVLGTSCCATSAEAAINQEFWMLGGVEDCAVDLERGRVWVRYDPGQTSPERLSAALAEIGYPATGVAVPDASR